MGFLKMTNSNKTNIYYRIIIVKEQAFENNCLEHWRGCYNITKKTSNYYNRDSLQNLDVRIHAEKLCKLLWYLPIPKWLPWICVEQSLRRCTHCHILCLSQYVSAPPFIGLSLPLSISYKQLYPSLFSSNPYQT